MAALQIAFAVISVAVVVVIAYFLHTCSREATPIPPMPTPPGTAEDAAATAGGDVELGMDEAAISALPRVVVHGGDAATAEASCAVCLGDYDRGDVLRVLPGCDHSFHRPCVDQWLRLRPSCPVCRTPPAPTAPSPAQAAND
ncbi:RING-H2 finger protein ATL70-like [Lolium rigidum]|uniref:RING-H2 finger protein ATL70-like n=1 Tax=Lolium rigidum TaxID=89674 RepID=UPI001F5DC3CD|nr:RING-H2 finger protein ATL70-like [Lolium rigidum]